MKKNWSSGQITLSGNAYKNGQTDHSSIKVILKRTSPSAYYDTLTTNSSGFFSKLIPVGMYDIKFYNDQYPFPDTFYYQRNCYTNQNLGNTKLYPVNGTLPKGNYYPGVITIIGTNDTLNISAGAKFYFFDGAGIKNNGYLLSNLIIVLILYNEIIII